ncbi:MULTISPECIES: hypothetical protein [unclassified Luteococcus]|uniref:hypothetical protein n=1 Tax=unclassified Luteococcus TaxID=2639923 RepID=UPI00313CF301
MVGTLVRLKLTLLRRSLQGQTAKIIGLVVIGLYALGALGWLSVALMGLRLASDQLHGGATTVGFAALTLGWPLGTLLVSGSDQTLDPGRFALFPVSARQLMPGLLVSGLVGIGGVFTALLALVQVASWSTGALTAMCALVAAILGCTTCILLARTAAASFSSALSTRRYRDGAALLLGLLAMGSGVGVQLVIRWLGNVEQLEQRAARLASVASWTPFGWAWALPWDAATGRWGLLAAHTALAVALVAALWLLWERSLSRALTSPLEAGGAGGRAKAHSVVDRLVPSGPAGAIAGRSLRYWRRDPRHLVLAVSVLLMPLLMLAPSLLGGSGEDSMISGRGILFPAIFSMLLLGSLAVAQEISYDGSALWMHISAGVSGRADRLGRLLAAGWILLPIALLIDVVLMAVSDGWALAPELVGGTLGSLLVGAAVGTVTGAFWQVPQPPPGQNAFSRGEGGGAAGILLSLVSMLATGLLALPFIIPLFLTASRPWLGWLLLGAAPVYGLALLAGSVVWGGRVLERSWPEVLKQVTYSKE